MICWAVMVWGVESHCGDSAIWRAWFAVGIRLDGRVTSRWSMRCEGEKRGAMCVV